MIHHLIGIWSSVVLTAALYTGFTTRPGEFYFTWMTGLLPPHYGYSAYAIVPLLFLGPLWARWAGGAALLLGGNRAAWVGAIAGGAWRYARGPHSAAILLLATGLGGAAVLGGAMLKPRSDNDSVRIQIWKAAARQAVRAPGEFCIGVDGYAVTKAHSDVLQLAATRGWKVAALVVLVLLWAFYRLPDGPGKAVVVALSVQSIVDNRLHHPACAALYVAAWIAAVRTGRRL